VTRTNRGFAQENYGLFHDLSALPGAGRHAGRRMRLPNFAEWNSRPLRTVPAAWLTGDFRACPADAAL